MGKRTGEANLDQPAAGTPLGRALDVVEMFAKAGLVAVPAEPTHDMIEAGQRVSGLSQDSVARIYRAMIIAAG